MNSMRNHIRLHTRLQDWINQKILYYEFDDKSIESMKRVSREKRRHNCESNSGTPPNSLISTLQGNLESLERRTQRYCTGSTCGHNARGWCCMCHTPLLRCHLQQEQSSTAEVRSS